MGESGGESLASTNVPAEMATRLDVWAELLLGARLVWNGVAAGFASIPPGDAPVANEDAYLNAQHPDWGEHPAWQAGMASAKLVDVASHYALGVGALTGPAGP